MHRRIRFFYDFAVHRKQMPTIIRRSVDEIQHIDKARRGLVVYNCKIIQMVDNLCTMCVLYSRYKLNFKNEGTITLVTGAFFAIHSFYCGNCGFVAKSAGVHLLYFALISSCSSKIRGGAQ